MLTRLFRQEKPLFSDAGEITVFEKTAQLPLAAPACQENRADGGFYGTCFCSAALCSAATAASAAWNPIFECVPSQNGFFVDAPQRHNDTAGFPSRLISVPSTSIRRIGPSTRSGPLGLAVIVTFASAIVVSP
jgi:hypothetical protein